MSSPERDWLVRKEEEESRRRVNYLLEARAMGLDDAQEIIEVLDVTPRTGYKEITEMLGTRALYLRRQKYEY